MGCVVSWNDFCILFLVLVVNVFCVCLCSIWNLFLYRMQAIGKTFFQVSCQLSQHLFLNKLSFPNELKHQFCHILNFHIWWDLFLNILFCFTSSSLYIKQYHMDSITVASILLVNSGFIKWSRRAFPHPMLCLLFFVYFSWPLEVCDHFKQLGVEMTLNFQINFGKFDIWYCLLSTNHFLFAQILSISLVRFEILFI